MKSWYRCCLLITHFGSVNQTDIEILYNNQQSIPAIYIPLHLYN